MLKKYILVVFTLLFSTFLIGQEEFLNVDDENGTNLNVLYRNDGSFKGYITPRGMGVLYRLGKHLTFKKRTFKEIDIQYLNSPKEISINSLQDSKSSFVYGKLNTVFLLRTSFGVQKVIFSKADNKAIEVRYSFSVGPTLAFAKPYYFQVLNKNGIKIDNLKFDSEKFSQESIVGRSGFFYGIDEIKIYPSVSSKFNLSFEYAPYTNLIRAVETGLSLDFFPVGIPIIANNYAENIVVSFHVGFVFGKKWF